MTVAPAAAPAARAGLPERLGDALERFAPVDAALLDRRALLGRSDAKFLLRAEAVPSVLRALPGTHAVLLAGGGLLATYETEYFDVPTLRGYDDHVRGRAPRHKVRTRRYPERGVSFLEVKSKGNRGRTEKARRPRPFGALALSPDEVAWALAITGWPDGILLPQASIRFRRITLVALGADERVTIDLDLCLARPPLHRRLGALAVAEVKQLRADPRSPAVLALRRAGARRRSFSKYAVAMGLLASGVRRNRLLPTLREIERYDTWQSSSAPTLSSTAVTSSSWCSGSPST